eukprot:scaffold5.g835.t1
MEDLPDYYAVLGVTADASQEDIKRAFRRKAMQHHPDTNPEAGRPSVDRFRQIKEAYEVLRDDSRRRQYDAMRRGGDLGGGGGLGGGYAAGPIRQPGVNTADIDAAFDAWFKRMSEHLKDHEEQRAAHERCDAERVARAAAWELEKQEAKLNRVRAERLRRRTEDARNARHASTLRRFWQTHHGFTRQDAVFLVLVAASTAGLAWAWRLHLQRVAADRKQASQTPVASVEVGGGATATAAPS